MSAFATRLNELGAAQVARLIETKEATAEALVSACLERIDERDDAVRAWAFINRKDAIAGARELDRMPRRSRLHGVPFGIKDIIDTEDLPTEYGSPVYRGHRPRADAACVALLKAAGCLILGKTVTTEFAQNHPSQTRNPRNPAHTPGGSSSGSAAAVADCMVPLALGTQTGGSVIRPAAYNGAFAIKPSFGSINRQGAKFVAESLDTIGIFARSVEDLAFSLEILSGRKANNMPSDTSRLRIGLCRTLRRTTTSSRRRSGSRRRARRCATSSCRRGVCACSTTGSSSRDSSRRARSPGSGKTTAPRSARPSRRASRKAGR
jgi:Asp-tRNA(Asn)/Glu-tRNA(Gln) amidotransferase A subunit family amidase